MAENSIWGRPAWAQAPKSTPLNQTIREKNQRYVGDRVQALYKDDNSFYEAVVTKVNPLTVKFCGYGNSAELRHSEVKTPPALPEGFTEHMESSTGYPYWVDSSGNSTWERPTMRVATKTVMAAAKFKKALDSTSSVTSASPSIYSREARLEKHRSRTVENRQLIDTTSSTLIERPSIVKNIEVSSRWKPNTVAQKQKEATAKPVGGENRRKEESTGSIVAKRLLGSQPSNLVTGTAVKSRSTQPAAVANGDRGARLDRQISAAQMVPGAFGVSLRGRRTAMQRDGCACGC